eukprot:403371198
MGDIEYLFSLAYYLIHMVSDLQLNSSQTQKNLMKELFKSSSGNQQQNTENVEMSKLTQFLDSNEDVQNLILLMCNSFTQQTNRIEFSNLTSQNSQNPMSGNFSTKNNFVKKVAVGSANILNQVMQQRNARQNEIMNTVGGDNEKIQNENDSLANYSQINGANATVENNQQRLDSMRASEMNEGFTQRDNDRKIGQGAQIQQQQFKQQNEITTIDLMYSYEPQKAAFQEDTVKKMTQRLKQLKKENKVKLEAFEDGNINLILGHLNQLQLSHIDFYGQKQLTQIMKSLFTENKLQISNYSINDNCKEIMKVPVNIPPSNGQATNDLSNLRQDEMHLEKILNEQLQLTATPQKQTQHDQQIQPTPGNNQDNFSNSQTFQYQTIEAVNQSKVNQYLKAIFQEFDGQYKVENKFLLNQNFYKILQHLMSNSGLNSNIHSGTKVSNFSNLSEKVQKLNKKPYNNKLSLEMKKFQKLGEIGGLSFVSYEMLENDGKISSDQLFQLAYECYDKLYQSGQSREILVKFKQLKNAKRTTQYWEQFWNGVINKCSQSLQMDCFKEIDYFRNAMKYAQQCQNDVQKLNEEISEHYNQIKRIILDFNYQLGKIRAFDFVIRIYKYEKTKLTQDINSRLTQLRSTMEVLDVKLVTLLNEQMQVRRIYSQYFKCVGENSMSKCVSRGLEVNYLVEMMIVKVLEMNCWQIFVSYMGCDKHENNSKLSARQEPSAQQNLMSPKNSQQQQQQQLLQQQQQQQQLTQSQIDKQELEKVMLQIIKFQKIKELDEKLMQDLKEEGVMGFDKFRAYTQRLAEEEEKQIQYFKTQTQVSHNQNLSVTVPAQQNIPIMERKGTFKNPSNFHSQQQQPPSTHNVYQPSSQSQNSNQSNFKPKLSAKIQVIVYSQDMIDSVNSVMDHEYTLAGRFNKKQEFAQFTSNQMKDLNYDLINDYIVQKPDFEKHMKLSTEFIELDLSAQFQNSPQKQITKLIGQHLYLTKLKQDLVNPQHLPMINEKKSLAHTLLEHFLKGLGQNMKSTRYQKQFKETRVEGLQLFVKALRSINKLGKWNNFDLSTINGGIRSGNLSMDQCFQTIVCIKQYLKEKERENLWKNLVSIRNPKIIINPETNMPQQGQINITEEMENSSEYKIFNQLFHLMKGTPRLKIRTKERIFKHFQKLMELYNMQLQQQKLILESIISYQDTSNPNSPLILESQSTLETYLSEQLFALGEEEDLQTVIQAFYKDKQVLFDRRRAKGIENYLLGVQNYLNILNDGEEKSELIHRVLNQVTKINDIQLQENKGLRIQTAVSQFRESSDKLMKRVFKTDYYVKLLNKVKNHRNIEEILSYLENQQQSTEKALGRQEKILQYLKANNVEDQEEYLVQQIGAKDMNNILSGQDFLDDIGKPQTIALTQQQNQLTSFLNQATPRNPQIQHPPNQAPQTSSDDPQYLSQRTLQIMTTFVKRLAFVDDRLSTLQILRNDQVFGFLQIMRQKLILGVRDKYRVREQYEEGLKHLINVFEIYKTPITHYQKSYERVCRYIQKELQQKIVSDGGSQTSGSSAGNTSQGNGSQQMLLFQFFEQISKKGSGLFQEIQNKLDVAFGKLEYEDSLRLDAEKIKSQAKRDLDTQTRIFKEFIDLEENNKVAFVKHQQIEHQNFRLAQEMAALQLLIRIFYIKLQQEENNGGFPLNYSPMAGDKINMTLQ